jgi:hypothetical protein
MANFTNENIKYFYAFTSIRGEAEIKEYTEFLDYFTNYCELDEYHGNCSGRISESKWNDHCVDVKKQTGAYPVLPYKIITAQARDLGITCQWPNKDSVGRMKIQKSHRYFSNPLHFLKKEETA